MMAPHSLNAEHYFKIKDCYPEDRPREKLVNSGKRTLTKAELLGIIIGSGLQNMNAVDLAKQILRAYDNDLGAVARLSVKSLTRFKGIGVAKASLIVSALELGNRLRQDLHIQRPTITTAKAAYQIMKDKLTSKITEEMWLILLDIRNKLIRVSQVGKGGLTRTIVDSKVLFKECLLHDTVGVILVHNHPSGNPTPSQADILFTKKIIVAAEALGLKILDHIVFSNTKYFSFADEGMIDLL